MLDAGRIRWLFFDVGDTLLDEREAMFDWCGQVAAELTKRGVPRITAADVWLAREQAFTEFAPDVLKRIMQVLSVPPADAAAYKAAKYRHELERPFDGVTDALKQLSRRFQLGVIANQARGVRDRLRGHGWGSLFAVCIASAEEGMKKPELGIFELALRRAGCRAEQAVMVGDRIDNDIRPARAVGMATVRVRQGLSKKQDPRGPFETPDVTIRRVRDLPKVMGV
jgi:HAD superfamily hydrolase (TIGR01662 family)